MSLINDALRRAKEVQTNHPPPKPENLPLRPAEPATQPKKGIGLVIPATAMTVLLAALFSFWQFRGETARPFRHRPRSLCMPRLATLFLLRRKPNALNLQLR